MTLLDHPTRTAKAPSTTLVATVYTREGCDCCRKALDVLEEAHDRYPSLVIETIDVASDPTLAEAYGAKAPVVAIGGKVRFRGQVNPVLLDRLLAAEG
jgi:glutaredoxin